MNKIVIDQVKIVGDTIFYKYSVDGEWKKFFTKQRTSFIKYSVDISNVHESVAVVPFICNVLPMVWLCDATMEIPYIDKEFFDHIDAIKKGYQDMYPMLKFKGNIKSQICENHSDKCTYEAGVFFSGGADAYATLLRHRDEKPILMTIWGADVKLSDNAGWNNVKSRIDSAAKEFGLFALYAKSDFRSVLDERECQNFVAKSGDGYWHGFQHGIAIISHMAPPACVFGMKKVYIASSYTEKLKGQYTCASDPTIDNNVRFADCRTIHDGYDMARIDKVRYIIKQKKAADMQIKLHVCWESSGGENCCRCEKCYRTILEIVAQGENPEEYGFKWSDDDIKKCESDMKNRIRLAEFTLKNHYPDILEDFHENKNIIKDYDKYQWLLNMDISKFNDMPGKILYHSIFARGLRKIEKIIRKKYS